MSNKRGVARFRSFSGIGKMTQKPTTGAEDEHSSAPNSPETNEEDVENIQEKNHEVMTPKFSVGQQLDILDSVNYWTEAEVWDCSLYLFISLIVGCEI